MECCHKKIDGAAKLKKSNNAYSSGSPEKTKHASNHSISSNYPDEEPPLRSELFSADQLEQHGKVLAATHVLTSARAQNPLLARLAENETVLISVCSLLTETVADKRRITPAEEWLLDNFYLIEEQIRTAKRHLPKAYSRELPRLIHGVASGLPRVYAIALEAISHGDGRIDSGGFSRFVAAYQTVSPLNLGELWAIPIMLRLALIENLRRVAVRIATGRLERNLADTWVDRMIEVAVTAPNSLILLTADMARSDPPMTASFISEFTCRLQGQGAALVLPLTWVEQQLDESNLTIEQLVQSGNQQQAADQLSIGNSIGSLRFLGAADWRQFVESMSVVEQILRTDPGAAYAEMDFTTRDYYRHQIEKIARRCELSENEVATQAIELATIAAASKGQNDRAAHVGFYLIDQGCAELEKKVKYRVSVFDPVFRMGRRYSLGWYLGAIGFITLLFTESLTLTAYTNAIPTEVWVLVSIVSLIASSQLAVALVNWLATLLASPSPLPKMDFSTGVPPAFRTLVIVPTLLTNADNVEALIEALEVRFLANRDDCLQFGLLTDFPDAKQEVLPEDAPLLHLVQERIIELNHKYGDLEDASNGDKFFLFHRARQWNPHEKLWMSYERKRGKLGDLNSLLRGGSADRFAVVVGRLASLTNVRYVITLDTDTDLPRDAGRQMVGAMAHPLNRPIYDEVKQRITTGYGIMQPRVSINLAGANRSRYARLHSEEAGIDPYTRAVSDVYQDVFHEGSFIGKGIYDIDAFERSLNGRFPENKILSHDLLEGCYARSGLLSDVQLYEDYPARYGVDMDRRHRWIRGDWQLFEWLLPSVPGLGKSRYKNPLSWLSQWKLFDNLRRSLVAPAMVLLLLFGWTLKASALWWTFAVMGIYILPPLCAALVDVFRKPEDVLIRQHLKAIKHSLEGHLVQVLFIIVWLPYEAFVSVDAIARTFWRMLITRQRRLEWKPFSDSLYVNGNDLAAHYRRMWAAPLIASVAALYLLQQSPEMLIIASPVLLLWLASPAIAWWMSIPITSHLARLSAGQTRFLTKISRKTWAFFETFVGPEDHWLPPDNYQEYRGAAVAHRTSPTNMGLALLANLTAYDFGYIPAGVLIERTANTLHTMQGMERHRGHFYNWYDTLSLRPLHPIYISTVDSGNLAGHLMTLAPGLLELSDDKIVSQRWLDGIHITVEILIEAMHDISSREISQFQADIESLCESSPVTLTATLACFQRLATAAQIIVAKLEADMSRSEIQGGRDPLNIDTTTGLYTEAQRNSTHNADRDHASAVNSELVSEDEACWWARLLARQCSSIRDELIFLAPWLLLPPAPGTLNLMPVLDGIPSLRELRERGKQLDPEIETQINAASDEEREWLEALRNTLAKASLRASERIAVAEQLVWQARQFAWMEYDFLYDKTRRLLAIGYNVDEMRRDASYYDLLASEARLCNFIAIAQGQLPQESWFALGRLLTISDGESMLLSWSGSMFEYLMPLLVMPTFDNTLIDQTYKSVVQKQIDYGKQRGVPWGMSESGYNTVDANFNYQYRVFGVPGLGLKRGLAQDLVVAPYASVLALMVMPEAACINLQRLSAAGMEGKFGFYEAIDYTASRQRRGETSARVRSFMAHHQGMSLLSLAYLLLNQPMQRRFESDPLFQATMLLLQERIPKETAFVSQTSQLSDVSLAVKESELPMRVLDTPDTPVPEVQLLSNGRYHVMVTHTGAGYSRWKDLAVTRWREDSTRDNWGSFCYIRIVESSHVWSAAYQPTLTTGQKYEAIFSEGRAEFRRHDHGIDTHTEIVVSPEDDIELRRVSMTNRSGNSLVIEVTSYAEVVLAAPAADTAHPAFSNLFVQTEILPEHHAILCTRRARSQDEQVPWMLHLMKVHGAVSGIMSYETDRMRFIGRCNTTANPQALNSENSVNNSESADLSGNSGSVLDPVAAIRCRITVEPGQTAIIDIVSGIGETRGQAMALIEKYQDRRLADRAFDLAWTHSQVVLRQINASEADAQIYGRLAGSVIYANAGLRADANVLLRNRRGQSGLWGYAISGDFPIVLLQIGDIANIELVRQLVQAHAYWRMKGLVVDLVIWNEDRAGYRQLLQEQIMGLVAAGIEAHVIDRPGGIFVRSTDQISDEDRVLFQSVARAIISDTRGTLEDQLNRPPAKETNAANLVTTKIYHARPSAVALPQRDLILFNGLGGFTPDGKEYVITTTPEKITPAPWVNVLANPGFGTVISESGMAYTWSENAHEFRLTPWQNDPVSDASGEAFYLRDEESGHFWSPTPLPVRGQGSYVSRHGFGYSVFECIEDGIYSELTVFVALDASVKFSVLKLHNQSGRSRQLSATGYAEWVLGDLRTKSVMHIATEIDHNALYATNPYNTEFPDRVAFFDMDAIGAQRSHSGSRAEFIGRNGTFANPAAMRRTNLSGKVGTALDPCAALQAQFELADGQTREIVFKLGVGRDRVDAQALVASLRGTHVSSQALKAVNDHWHHTLGAVQIETPDKSLDVLTNGWLVYQTIACRLWARTGYYQSGGAFGFRDQLQDVMALIHTQPKLIREQLLRCGSRQFPEGDVQHWWHPPIGRGVRTHCSDDYLWLPLVACRYVFGTGDIAVMDEPLPFLEGRLVPAGEDSYYDLPGRSADVATLYQHCVSAIQHGLRFGDLGLPLMGSGDWNDGMNLVGLQGKGQSVWLGFFLCDVLKQFAKLARMYGDPAFAELCDAEFNKLSHNIEENAWDGNWYRRAYFDDGTPLGSNGNTECQIDSISQSWAVLSGAGDAQRSRSAMDRVYQRLVRRDSGLIQLLDPPFDHSELDPGYIKGYVPGVRENGGQYTHSAIWTAMAFAALGDHERAWELTSMINPLNHALDPAGVATYKVEPYVISADVYSVSPHVGRGGWSWYTGSAGWMYRLIVESLLGLKLEGDKLHFSPCLPAAWQSFKMQYRYGQTLYRIHVLSSHGEHEVPGLKVDGVVQLHNHVSLIDDQKEHLIEMQVLGTQHPDAALPASG